MHIDELYLSSVELLKKLVATPSLSGQEQTAAQLIREHLFSFGIPYQSTLNNTWCFNQHWDDMKPVVLLNSHIDTVKPVNAWTYDPFGATVEDGKLIGLGSNDAGGPLVSLLGVFMHYYNNPNLPFNLIFSATAEEESSGPNGVALMVKHLPKVDFAIVGEPTQMKLAVAEKGLLVIDSIVRGKAGHAAREEGINSIYLALNQIEKIKDYRFEKVSPRLGSVKMTVTQIEAGFQHNVVPDICKFVIDVRTNECYTNDEVIGIISNLLSCEVNPRSTRLNSSGIEMEHPFVKRAQMLGIECYGSPTLSDQSLMHFKSVKIGPGDSARSHTANEYIVLDEIKQGISTYIQLLDGLIIVK
jgi:acetylornithine deacetylase